MLWYANIAINLKRLTYRLTIQATHKYNSVFKRFKIFLCILTFVYRCNCQLFVNKYDICACMCSANGMVAFKPSFNHQTTIDSTSTDILEYNSRFLQSLPTTVL